MLLGLSSLRSLPRPVSRAHPTATGPVRARGIDFNLVNHECVTVTEIEPRAVSAIPFAFRVQPRGLAVRSAIADRIARHSPSPPPRGPGRVSGRINRSGPVEASRSSTRPSTPSAYSWVMPRTTDVASRKASFTTRTLAERPPRRAAPGRSDNASGCRFRACLHSLCSVAAHRAGRPRAQSQPRRRPPQLGWST
jgi:hypothetical protein